MIEPTLGELQAMMREAENDPQDGKTKCEALWPILKLNSTSEEPLYMWSYMSSVRIKAIYADRNLICKWKKPGYERLCC